MVAESLMHCVEIAMEAGGEITVEADAEDEDAEDEDPQSASDAPYYPSLINIARDLVNQSIRNLDSYELTQEAETRKYEVKEDTPEYVH